MYLLTYDPRVTTLLMPLPAAIAELQRPTGIYLGADGFWLDTDGVTPSLEHIADLSELFASQPDQTRDQLLAILRQWPGSPSFAVELVRHDEGFDTDTPYVTDLLDFDRIVVTRHLDWHNREVTWSVGHGPPTDKPAAWLVLSGRSGDGQLTVWVSGEAEMDWGDGQGTQARHYDLMTDADLLSAVRDLETAVGLA